MNMILLALGDIPAIQGVLQLAFNKDGHRLVHLVARHDAVERTRESFLGRFRHFVVAFSVRMVRTRAMSRRV